MSVLFRQIPPWSLVEKILSLLKLPSEFPVTFQRENLFLDYCIEAVSLLEPFYIPCKAKKYLDHTNDKRWITILRQILKPHNCIIQSHETTRNKKKAFLYTIIKIESELKEAYKIDFS